MMQQMDKFAELDEKQVDDILACSRHYSDMGMQRVKDKVLGEVTGKRKPSRRKFRFRRWLAVSVAAALMISAIAVTANEVGLRQLLHSLWGEGSELVAGYVDDIDQTVQQNGLAMSLLAAYREEGDLTVIYSLTDVDADRLSGENQIRSGFLFENEPVLDRENEPVIQTEIYDKLLGYDAETRTATYLKTSPASRYLQSNDAATFTIAELKLGMEDKEYTERALDLYALLQGHTASIAPEKEKVFSAGGNMLQEIDIDYEAGMTLVEKDEIKIPFEQIGWMYITNIGFVDGRLHIQAKPQLDTENRVRQMHFTDAAGNVVYGGEEDGVISISHGFYEDSITYGMYHEYIFDSVSSAEQLKGLFLEIETMEYLEVIKDMDLSVTFEIPEKMPKITIAAEQEVRIYNETAMQGTIILTPLYLKFEYITENSGMFGNVENDVSVIYQDGTRVALKPGVGGKSLLGEDEESPRYLTYAKFENGIIDIDEVESVYINGQEFAVNH